MATPEPTQSEFGRGTLVCLLGFLDHKARLTEWLKLYEDMRGKHASDRPDLFTDEHAVNIWANGASDHLYELEVPPRLIGTPLAARLEAFREKWLDIGHGFQRTASRAEAFKALEECERLALEVAAELDKLLGVDAQVGQWT